MFSCIKLRILESDVSAQKNLTGGATAVSPASPCRPMEDCRPTPTVGSCQGPISSASTVSWNRRNRRAARRSTNRTRQQIMRCRLPASASRQVERCWAKYAERGERHCHFSTCRSGAVYCARAATRRSASSRPVNCWPLAIAARNSFSPSAVRPSASNVTPRW